MSQFEKFKEKLSGHYGSDYTTKEKDYIFNFMEDFFFLNKNPLNGELKEDGDEEEYDSYGNEASRLNRVLYFSEFDIFVKFIGIRQSHVGEEWMEMKEVSPVTKTIETYE